ncbi:hypothetical protein Hypma_003517 [Hypsizygus marmoreus]|uniref:F-box domain-containing protein n=1 Tax=Hypsizygus marmoreus TaxID=39966 RepID=A0A369JAV2_HYPMA|nr:hypothetical protein Hypma_003517 [Hypsizygus marmoreus]
MTTSTAAPPQTFYHKIEFEAGTSNSIILSSLETHIAKSLVIDAQYSLAVLDLQIAELCEQRNRNAARLERLCVAVAPHKRLPSEILSHIFLLSADEQPLGIPLQMKAPQWVLRQVCSRWRHIALDNRHLWNNISIDLVMPTRPWGSEDVHNPKLALSESTLPMLIPATGPLTLMLRGNDPAEQAQSALHVLMEPYAERIMSLHLSFSSHALDQFFEMLPNKFTTLESLNLEFIDPPSFSTTYVCSFPPSLRRLEVSGHSSIIWCFRSSEINWALVTAIDFSLIKEMTFFQISEILICCANLETCGIALIGGIVSAPPHVHLTLPRLRSLSITLETASIFDSFTLPALEHLDVSSKEKRFPFAEITSMISQSGCALQTFVQRGKYKAGVGYDPVALASLFTATP